MRRVGCASLCRLCCPDAGVRLLHSSRLLQLKKKVVPLPAFFRQSAASAEAAGAALPPAPSPSASAAEASTPSDSASGAAAGRGPVLRHFGHGGSAAGGTGLARSRPSAIARSRRADDRADDASWDWKMGIIVERRPLVLNRQTAGRSHSSCSRQAAQGSSHAALCVSLALCVPAPLPWQVQWEELQLREEARHAVPIPPELRPTQPKLGDDQAEPALVPTLTAADAAGDLRSLDRSLSRALYLLVKRRNGHTGEERWTLPAVDFTALPAASVLPKAAAHSAVRAALGSDIVVHPLGNAPVAYHRFAYSQQYKLQASTRQQGCKVQQRDSAHTHALHRLCPVLTASAVSLLSAVPVPRPVVLGRGDSGRSVAEPVVWLSLH